MPKKLLHGIDMAAPGAVAQLLAFHYATFGDAVMKDGEGEDNEDDDAEDQDADNDDAQDNDDNDDSGDGAEDLGDKGKRALDAMKAKLKASKAEARTAKAEADQLKAEKANAGKPADEQAIENAKREATEAALSTANKRILRSEVKAAAAGKLANPALAIKLIDLDELEVDEDGNVDEDAIAEAISNLLEENPYLAAQGGTTKFDSARGKPKPKTKLTAADLEKMTPAQIAKAYDEGRVKA
ncbi:hypothetical protein HWD94_04035 [Pseudarthrobacter equi]|uniref:hypothetical protein n=1 Tax=Pseudarthrobacter equi TaxID=728066 RepID=UPI0021C233EE|nr:hypothetical protein [Pseudarthrobacter equi]MCT9624293.1 hypothetical protein [Pseudarthrobacter equi]